MWLFWLLVSVGGLFLVTTTLFVAIMQAKTLRDLGELNKFWSYTLLPAALLGLALDVVWNLTIGTVLFLELPKEWLFSHRVYRHWNVAPYKNDKRRFAIAEFCVKQLNLIDPNHIWREP